MSDTTQPNPIVLTDAQRQQFYSEVDQLGAQVMDRANAINPLVGYYLGNLLEQQKEQPEQTLEMLINIGREITDAVRRIHNAGGPQSQEDSS